MMGDNQSSFDCDPYEIPARESKLDGALWRVVLEQFRHGLLHLAQYPLLGG